MQRLPLMLCAAILTMGSLALAQPGPGGGGPGGGRGPGMNMPMGGPFQEIVATLGDLSLTPTFELTKEQREKIQAIRDQVKKDTDKWLTDNADAIKKLQEERAAMFGGGQPDPEKRQALMKSFQDLMATFPKTDEQAKAIRAVLTEEQIKAVEARQAERQAEQAKLMQLLGGPGGGGPGGGGGRRGGGGGGNNPPPPPPGQ